MFGDVQGRFLLSQGGVAPGIWRGGAGPPHSKDLPAQPVDSTEAEKPS